MCACNGLFTNNIDRDIFSEVVDGRLMRESRVFDMFYFSCFEPV